MRSTCWEVGCEAEGSPYYYTTDPKDTPSEYLCAHHAREYGYCTCCHSLAAEGLNHAGLCNECAQSGGELPHALRKRRIE